MASDHGIILLRMVDRQFAISMHATTAIRRAINRIYCTHKYYLYMTVCANVQCVCVCVLLVCYSLLRDSHNLPFNIKSIDFKIKVSIIVYGAAW